MARSSPIAAQLMLRSFARQIEHSLRTSTHLRETAAILAPLLAHLSHYDHLLSQCAASNMVDDEALGRVISLISQKVPQFSPDIRGLSDASCDRIPFVLATYLNHELRCTPGLPGDSSPIQGLALYAAPTWDYYYEPFPHSLKNVFAGIDEGLAQLLPKAPPEHYTYSGPPFPENVGVVGFPHPMTNDFLHNITLFHELGHVVFNRTYLDTYQLTINECLEGHKLEMNKQLEGEYPTDESRRLAACRYVNAILVAWCSELFSDCLAIATVGPVYSFGFRNVCNPAQRTTTFTDTHPAPALRQQVQSDFLAQMQWNVGLSEDECPGFLAQARKTFASLRACAPSGPYDFGGRMLSGLPHGLTMALPALLQSTISKIKEDAASCVLDATKRAEEFWDQASAVADALNWAMVPSTVVVSGKTVNPRPSTVMNVAAVLYEMGCAELLQNWLKNRKRTPEKRQQAQSRLSEWTLKAVSDWLLLEGARRGRQHKGSS